MKYSNKLSKLRTLIGLIAPLCLVASSVSGVNVLSIDSATMQADTSDGIVPAFAGSEGKVIVLDPETPILTAADDSYSGPDVYGGLTRNIFKGGGGVSNNGGSGWRARVNATIPFDENTNNSGPLDSSVLFVFKTEIDGSPVTVGFSEGADLLDASDIFTSDMAKLQTGTIYFVIRDGGSWYISESSPNLQSGDLSGNTTSMHSANALSTNWYAYDPLTDVDTEVTMGALASPSFTSVDFVGFLLETTSLEEQSGYNFGVRIFNVEASTGSEPTTWAGYAIDENGWVDTADWLGWINVMHGDFVWINALQKYWYMPESNVGASGSWGYNPAQ